MKILILEGVATSGKSTVIKILEEKLKDKGVRVYDEAQTHIPIMERSGGLHLGFFVSLLQAALEDGTQNIIFDRLYLTQAFRAKASISDYSELEETLQEYQALTIFLRVDESVLIERIKRASMHREKSWGEYIQTKGNTFEEIAKYYENQQLKQLSLLKESKLRSVIFDTTDHDYEKVADEIIAMINTAERT